MSPRLKQLKRELENIGYLDQRAKIESSIEEWKQQEKETTQKLTERENILKQIESDN